VFSSVFLEDDNFYIFNFKGIMRMMLQQQTILGHVWQTAHVTSTATSVQVSSAIARSVQNEHRIAANG